MITQRVFFFYFLLKITALITWMFLKIFVNVIFLNIGKKYFVVFCGAFRISVMELIRKMTPEKQNRTKPVCHVMPAAASYVSFTMSFLIVFSQ